MLEATQKVETSPNLLHREESQRLLDLAALSDAKEGIRQGLEQLHRGEGRPAREFFDELCEKHGISR